jgi:anti-sigma B factor antagonist
MSHLNIEEREGIDGIVLDLSGDIIFGEANTALRNGIRNRLMDGKINITLNLKEVGYLDSSGIGELISALTAVSREGGRMVILNPGERVQRLFEISKLTEIFEVEYADD